MERCAIGLIGWGTVGGGVVEILSRDAELLRERCGLDLQLTRIVTRTPSRPRTVAAPDGVIFDTQIDDMLADPAIRTIIHLVGGTGIATEMCRRCLAAGKHVVTANKAMLSEQGDELFALAAENGVSIAFEAAVAGGIPIIAALRDGLVANRIEGIHAILNGTCNYILTSMENDDVDYNDALSEAQRLGYAEEDPTLDVNGTDTAHKLAILARIAFNGRVPFADIRVEGIQNITALDIASARALGARIKLLAVAQMRPSGLELRVAPTLVPLDHPLAAVHGSQNGIAIASNNALSTFLMGPGAGALPTASAVVADVVDVCAGRYQETFSRFHFVTAGTPVPLLPEAEEFTASYARFTVADRTGVLAGIASRLSSHGISFSSLRQMASDGSGPATIEVLTHPIRGGAFLDAVEAIDAAGLTLRPTTILRKL
jgi:homoserine dehydrogenase